MHGNKHVTKGDNQMARDKLLSIIHQGKAP